jgi:hypothetical protein
LKRSSRDKPAGISDGNCIQTMPGKGWNAILRVYNLLESFFDKSERQGRRSRAMKRGGLRAPHRQSAGTF